MDYKDIIALARAGFSAEQIAKLREIATDSKSVEPDTQSVQAPTAEAVTMEGMRSLLTDVLGGFALKMAEQPAKQTTDDIIASIINPKEV